MNLLELYQSNSEFHDYVDKYCRKHGISVTEAIEHKTIKAVAEYCLKPNIDKL